MPGKHKHDSTYNVRNIQVVQRRDHRMHTPSARKQNGTIKDGTKLAFYLRQECLAIHGSNRVSSWALHRFSSAIPFPTYQMLNGTECEFMPHKSAGH